MFVNNAGSLSLGWDKVKLGWAISLDANIRQWVKVIDSDKPISFLKVL